MACFYRYLDGGINVDEVKGLWKEILWMSRGLECPVLAKVGGF